jgi:hypothetical protein
VPGETVESPIVNDSVSSEISATSDLEASIQQPSPIEPPPLTQTTISEVEPNNPTPIPPDSADNSVTFPSPPEAAPTPQPDAISSVSELAIASPIQRQTIPEPPQNDERQDVEAPQAQTSLSPETEASSLRQSIDEVTPLGESPIEQQQTQHPVIQSDTNSSSPPEREEQATQPEISESSAEPQANALTDSSTRSTAASASPLLTPNLPEIIDVPTSIEQSQEISVASPELTTSTEPETIQPRFQSAPPRAETATPPSLDLPTIDDEVEEQRSQALSALPLSDPTAPSNAVLPSAPTPDSPPSTLEPTTPFQSTSPATSIPTDETEAIVQPQLESASDSTSATSASIPESGSSPDNSEIEVSQSPQIETPAQQSSQVASPTPVEEVSIQPQPESPPELLTEVNRTSPTPEPATDNIESTAIAANPQRSDSSGLTKDPQQTISDSVSADSTQETPRANRETEISTNELQSEVGVQRQGSEEVAEAEELSQTSDEFVANNLKTTEPSSTLQKSPSVSEPISAEPPITGREVSEPAIAPNLASEPPTLHQPLVDSEPTLDSQTSPLDSDPLQPPSVRGDVRTRGENSDSIQVPHDIQSTASFGFPREVKGADSSDSPLFKGGEGGISQEPDLIQPFRQTDSATNLDELPKLPTVLQDLSILNPLGSTPLIQTASLADTASPAESVPAVARSRSDGANVVASRIDSFSPPPSVLQTASNSLDAETLETSIQRSQLSPVESPESAQTASEVAEVPTEWSSIAELLESSSFSVASSSTQASPPFPDLQPFQTTETAVRAQLESPTHPTQSDASSTIETDEEPSNVTEETRSDREPSPQQLEKLAREIYSLLRQRLKIEQERNGNSYSGRLPW